MKVLLATVVGLATAAGIGLGLWLRSRLMKRIGYDEWRRRWKQVDRARRRRIARAVRRGRAVDDPRDAALAVEYAAQVEKLAAASRRHAGVARAAEAVLAVLALLAAARGDYRELIVIGSSVVAIVVVRATVGSAKRIAEARRRNEELAAHVTGRPSAA